MQAKHAVVLTIDEMGEGGGETRYYSFYLFPCWSVLEFWKFKLEKSSSTNWIFSQQESILKLICAGSKNQVWNRLKIKFMELDFFQIDFSEIKYRSTRGLCVLTNLWLYYNALNGSGKQLLFERKFFCWSRLGFIKLNSDSKWKGQNYIKECY